MKHGRLPKFNVGIHFVTTNLHRRKPLFLSNDLCLIMVEELDYYRDYYGYKIFAYVIMPDNLHILIWWDVDKKPELRISKIMQSVKSVTAKRIIKYFENKNLNTPGSNEHVLVVTPGKSKKHVLASTRHINSTRHFNEGKSKNQVLAVTLEPYKANPNKKFGIQHTKPKHKIWQKGAYDFNILTDEKLEEKINYIHQNPYKDPRIKNPETYPFSSERFYLYGEEGPLKIDSLEDL